MNNSYVIGMDFGTDSVRSVIVNATTGEEISSHVSYYKRWTEGKYCDSSKYQFRQHPLDHLEALEESIKEAIKKVGNGGCDISQKILAIGIDTTGSTPAPVDKDGTVLALREEFKDNPNAMFILWKDHTAVDEAYQINKVSKSWGGIDFTKYVGGVYSSEWFWAKILHILRTDPKIREYAFSWVEHADWIPAILTGNTNPLTMKRSRCAAGHKAMWHKDWDGLPCEEFLAKIDPLLKGIRKRLYTETYTSDTPAGGLTKEWAEKLGLEEGIPVTVGAFDAHMGAVGAGIKEKTLVKILGTSCCDIAVAKKETVGDRTIEGICGQVDGSVIPGMIGLEAGQSSFGDVYAWFRDILIWPVKNLLDKVELTYKLAEKDMKEIKDQIEGKIIPYLSEEASMIDPKDTGLLALDWLNGRRTPYADQKLKGVLAGLTLGSTAPKIFRALVESTCFGSKAIVERFSEEKIEIKDVIGIGGIATKSPFVMQVLSDVLDMPVKVAKSGQAVALGAAMFASVVAGIYPTVEEAQKNMGSGFSKTYYPSPKKAIFYKELYTKYKELGSTLEDTLRRLG